MPSLPTNPHNIGDSGHVNDHNTIVTALSSAAFLSGSIIQDQAGTTISGFGAWTSYTPVLTASTTNPTLGTGSTQAGAYTQIGKTVHFRARIVFGSSGVNAGSGYYAVSLPVAAKSAVTVAGHGVLIGGSRYLTAAYTNGTTKVELYLDAGVAVSNTAPFTWAATNAISIAGTYEVA